MKDYKKIYLRLKRDIKKQIELYETYRKEWNRGNIVEQIELNETIDTLDHMYKTMEELEGKENYGILFTSEKFKIWKKSIRSKK